MSCLLPIITQLGSRPGVIVEGDRITFPWGVIAIGTDGSTWTGLVIPNWMASAYLKVNNLQPITHDTALERVQASLLLQATVVDNWYRDVQPELIEREAAKLASLVRYMRRELRAQFETKVSIGCRHPMSHGIAMSVGSKDQSRDELEIVNKLMTMKLDQWCIKHGVDSFVRNTTIEMNGINDDLFYSIIVEPRWNVTVDELEVLLDAILRTRLRIQT